MKILLIHCNLIKPTNIKSVLSNFGQVTEYCNCINAMNEIVNFNIKDVDIVFIDMMMPGFSGIDISKKIREFEETKELNKSYIVLMVPHNFKIKNPESIYSVDKIMEKPITIEDVESYLKEINLI